MPSCGWKEWMRDFPVGQYFYHTVIKIGHPPHGTLTWCGGCPVWWMSGVVDVLFYPWCGGFLVWWMSVWLMSYNYHDALVADVSCNVKDKGWVGEVNSFVHRKTVVACLRTFKDTRPPIAHRHQGASLWDFKISLCHDSADCGRLNVPTSYCWC